MPKLNLKTLKLNLRMLKLNSKTENLLYFANFRPVIKFYSPKMQNSIKNVENMRKELKRKDVFHKIFLTYIGLS